MSETDRSAISDAATLRVAMRAARWLDRLPSSSTQERESLSRWLRRSAANRREFLLALKSEQVLRTIARRNSGTDGSMRNLRAGVLRQRARWMHAWSFVAAGLATTALLLTMLSLGFASRHAVETGVAKWHAQLLEDGSIVRLGPDTSLSFEFSERRRFVDVTHGEVLFDIARDTAARPFVVRAGLATLRTQGAIFGVQHIGNRADDNVVVTVAEGIVAVTALYGGSVPDPVSSRLALMLGGDQQATVSRGGVDPVATIDSRRALAWAQKQLIFEGTRVAAAAEELNRRNVVQVQVVDPLLAAQPIPFMNVNADDPESFAQFVAAKPGTVLTRTPGVLRLDRAGGTNDVCEKAGEKKNCVRGRGA